MAFRMTEDLDWLGRDSVGVNRDLLDRKMEDHRC